MQGEPADDGQEHHSVSFLLEEYKSLQESFLRNEELGERRVNFFITLTTAVIGALAAIWKISIDGIDLIFLSFGLAFVFLSGIVTLARIIRRNLITHEYLRALGRIRKYFADINPKIQPFLPYPPCDDRPQREKKWKDICSLGTGGLVEMVSLVNSLVVAAICMLAGYGYPWWVFVPFGLLGLVTAWIGQFRYVMYRYEKEKKEITKNVKFPCPNGD